MRYLALSVIVGAFLFISVTAMAWGPSGHRITAAVAYARVDEKVKDSLKFYLGKSTLEDASTWMDEIRSDAKYDYLKPYHYINIDKGKKYDRSIDSTNIIEKLATVIGELKQRNKLSKEQIETDIKILTHLMGDLHQPLHVGYGDDQGGNTILVNFMSWNSNLHKVWDTEIIEQDNIKAKDCIKLLSKYSKEDIAKFEKVDLLGWLNESRSYLGQVYAFKGNKIDYEYAAKNTDVIEKQLAVGGLRLAGLLTAIFESK